MLREGTIRVDARDETAPRFAAFVSVNPAAPARLYETEAIERLVLPVDSPLRGGRVNLGVASFNKHCWVAAPFAGTAPGDVWITLPRLTLNGSPARFDEVHLVRHLALGRGLFDC